MTSASKALAVTLVHGGIDGHRPVALLPPQGMIIQAGHGYRDPLLGQPVERVQQFHVLEVVRGQEQNPTLCKHHETDPTLADCDGPSALHCAIEYAAATPIAQSSTLRALGVQPLWVPGYAVAGSSWSRGLADPSVR